ncbi:hypothetical protein UCDDS831_g08283 [Diplodia seriata]|uniref:Uncharacterized protein n=1 Tax=Diplodia seriata TaxID=420778 RepID=A0A0G2DTV9_9PEZI|nr:hypothetical protein UCDDS831_g08283 [Diplodia seriata]
MSTCLRQVPAYIAGRQQWEDDENVNKVDASEEVYQELEQMGSALGWRPLREVTRAHGVALVTEAVAEGLLDTVHIERLVRLCHGSLAYDEAEDILTAFAFATEPLPPPKTAKDAFIYSEDQRFSSIVTAHAWAKKIDGWSFFYRLIRSMLISNIVPVEWTATTQFKNIWNITCDVLGGHLDKPIAHSSSTVERLSNILTCAIITGVCTFSNIPNIAVAPVPLNIRALARLEGITGHQLLNLPAIVCSVAETCGKAYDPKTTQNVFLVLRSIVEALKSYRVSSFDDGKFTGSTLSSDWKTVGFSSWILKRLALDSAHEFADHSQDSSVGNTAGYVQYTLEIEKEMENIRMPRHDIPFFHKDDDAGYHVGYRWESAISEWVEATPLVRMSALGPAAADELVFRSSTPMKKRPLPPATPARPTLSQLLLLAQSPDVLGFGDDTPVAPATTASSSFSEKIAAASADTAHPPPPSTPAAALRALRNDTDNDDDEHDDQHDARADDAEEYETDDGDDDDDDGDYV